MRQPPTIVLVHGSGDTSRVWRHVRGHLAHPSVAVDLLGRGRRPYDLTQVTLDDAARVAAADVQAESDGPWIVVAHSAGALVAPRLVARLTAHDRSAVRHLVLVAGVVAAEGGQAVDIVQRERRVDLEARRGPLLERYRGHTYVSPTDDETLAHVDGGLQVLRDPRLAQSIESLNLLFQPVSWQGVPDGLPRTWVRCLRDPLQSREVQEQLALASGATAVRDIDSGHTPARDAPDVLAAMLDEIAAGA
mgnify:CR=1 FL=1